jgi:hypothetical protein
VIILAAGVPGAEGGIIPGRLLAKKECARDKRESRYSAGTEKYRTKTVGDYAVRILARKASASDVARRAFRKIVADLAESEMDVLRETMTDPEALLFVTRS